MIKKLLFVGSIAFLAACSNNNSGEQTGEQHADTTKSEAVNQPENELADFKFRTLVINIPSPFEVVASVPKAKIPFKDGLINSTDNVSKYTSTTKKGLNYGVYVTDLVYLSSNEHFADVKGYFNASAELAKSLEFYQSFENIVGARLEQNIDKKDSINKIMDQVYTEMDNYLRSNDRLLAATQILVGSWVEGQYLTISQLVDQSKNAENEAIFQKVLEETFTSKKLVEVLKDYETEKEFKTVIEGVKELDKLYADLHSENDLKKEVLKKLHTKLIEVRSKIVN